MTDSVLSPAPGSNGAEPEENENEGYSETYKAPTMDATTPPINQAFNQDVKDRYEESLAVADALPEAPHLVDTDYVIAAHLDPARQRDPNGIYLDDIMRRDAETVRARIEGREPDYENPGTTAGDVLQDKHTASKFVDSNADVPVHTTLPVLHGVPESKG